jgi:hypothetical protein
MSFLARLVSGREDMGESVDTVASQRSLQSGDGSLRRDVRCSSCDWFRRASYRHHPRDPHI